MNMKKLSIDFYQREDVVAIAQELLGKLLVTVVDGKRSAGRIVETEAYNGIIDRAAHSYGGRRTQRTEIMFAAGGVAYVYLCYGIHYLFNVVTNTLDHPQAVLIRALEPVSGVAHMLDRTRKLQPDTSLTRGPGNVARAMGIDKTFNGHSLLSKDLFIADDGHRYQPEEWMASPRIGVDYAGDDAQLPYRFYVKGNPYLSGRLR